MTQEDEDLKSDIEHLNCAAKNTIFGLENPESYTETLRKRGLLRKEIGIYQETTWERRN